MRDFDKKINEQFEGLLVRKDLVKAVKGNAIVPTYVLEYLLGQYCATNDETTINTGIETVKEILRKHYVHRNEAGLVRSNIKERGRYRIIDKISVSLNDKADLYEAEFFNLGLKKVVIDSGTVKAHPKLLVGGVWCIADLEYQFSIDGGASPWILSAIKPIQLSSFDFDRYVRSRREFTLDEWIDLLVQSIGFDPNMFGRRSKLTQLIRLIPFCERNYNLIELGPKGTGKSHIYSEFSPHGILLSGGEVTVAKLFVNNSSGKIGLVGYWDCVAFDEFAGRQKKVDKALVDILKNYMANKSFSRGVETLGAEASMVFVGNTQHTVPYMLKNSDLFSELPDKFYDSAFLDRLHFYIPGWEVDIIRGEMFTNGYGFVVDYLAEVLRSLRNHDYSNRYQEYFSLSSDISTRDRDGINKTFSGLMKLLFPDGGASKDEIEELLKFSIEGRKRVKDQLMRIDQTYTSVTFSYTDTSGQSRTVKTLEEADYPDYYYQRVGTAEIEITAQELTLGTDDTDAVAAGPTPIEPTEAHFSFQENQSGISFETLFAKYLRGAKSITVTDAYLRAYFQLRNLMELVEVVACMKPPDEEIQLHVVTSEDDQKPDQQLENLERIKASASSVGVKFSFEFAEKAKIHARHIVSDTGWKISLDRGLDIFQYHDMNDTFAITNRIQRFRRCKSFEITYIRID